MARDVWRVLLADREQRRAPELAGVLVADVERLARLIRDGIVRPRRDLVLAAVDGPRVAAARLRHLKAEGGIRHDVDPRGRRPLTLTHDDHVFAPVVGETSQAVEELEMRPWWWHVRRDGAGIALPEHGRGWRDVHPLDARDLLGQRSVTAEQHGPRRPLQHQAIGLRESIAAKNE